MKNNEIIKLSELKINEKAEITGFLLDKKEEERLEALGIKRGGIVASVRIAPFSRTTIISLSGRLYAVRSETAEKITVKRI